MGRHSHAYGDWDGSHAADEAIEALATRQHGVVSYAQLVHAGLTRQAIWRRTSKRRLTRLHLGVYAVGHRALTGHSRDLAAVLACGPRALLSHRSAAHRWGLRRTSSDRIEVTAPRGRTHLSGVVVHRSRCVGADDRALLDGIPVTSVARTLVDLAEVLSERRLSDAVHEAEVLKLFDLVAVQEALARVPGRAGRHRLRRVLASYMPEPIPAPNAFEKRFLELCSRHDLPTPQTRVTMAGYELDFLWPHAELAVETDGAAVHHTRRSFHADRRRDRALAAAGIQVIRVTWPDLDDPERLSAELAAILARSRPPGC